MGRGSRPFYGLKLCLVVVAFVAMCTYFLVRRSGNDDSRSLTFSKHRITFVFLVSKDVLNCRLWQRWLRPELFAVVIHSSAPLDSGERCFPKSVYTHTSSSSWGFIMDPIFAGLRKGLKDEMSAGFMLVSSDTIPLKPARIVFDELISKRRSGNLCRMYYSNFERIPKLLVPDEFRVTHHTWGFIGREQALVVLGGAAVSNYRFITADEHYIGSVLSASVDFAPLLVNEPQCFFRITWKPRTRAVTPETIDFGDFTAVDNNPVGNACLHPVSVLEFQEAYFTNLIAEKNVLFFRKVLPNATVKGSHRTVPLEDALVSKLTD